jgi:hypothetical protein
MPAKKPADVSVIDQMAADAAPAEYPEGTPELRPWLQIRPRSRRAQFKRKYAEFSKVRDDVRRFQESGLFNAPEDGAEETPERTAEKLRMWADMDDYYQLMDELLELAALDPVAYRSWSDAPTLTDETLSQAFTVYMMRTQPGEASSSAS